jgi:hypothetical protein
MPKSHAFSVCDLLKNIVTQSVDFSLDTEINGTKTKVFIWESPYMNGLTFLVLRATQELWNKRLRIDTKQTT